MEVIIRLKQILILGTVLISVVALSAPSGKPAPTLVAHADLKQTPTNHRQKIEPLVEVRVVIPATPVATVNEPPISVGGNCGSWIAAAGIDNPEAASFIFMKESGCRPEAVNGSGCRGLGQACPGSKLPCSSSDGVCQAKWFDGYCKSRYGSWSAAKAFWLSHHYW